MAGLSKSRIMSSLQCLKRVHLEIHRKDLLEYSKATEASFAIGHEVGDMAIRLYGQGRGSEVEYGMGSSGGWICTGQHIARTYQQPVPLPR